MHKKKIAKKCPKKRYLEIEHSIWGSIKKNIKKRERERKSTSHLRGRGVALVLNYFTTPRKGRQKKKEKEHVSTEGRVVLLVVLPIERGKKRKKERSVT